ncbi:hypothetical protein N7468_005552 [Penicillium chermesinum]|uniref:Uncharacterized protein n=1 Tax=Penicillium chermesinum TaxID=63820 RepID=A0A9W9TN33_9EURO|nr:uncharacterized protein N7468_005552 [Penicillium chermesinum]KAJ5232596.1 hypothetical protein N7468_005552 [Penicillium chermesinum]
MVDSPPAQPVGVQQRSPSSAAPARSPASTVNSTQDDKSNASRRLGEGFNWSEALRSRAERAPSIGGPISPPLIALRITNVLPPLRRWNPRAAKYRDSPSTISPTSSRRRSCVATLWTEKLWTSVNLASP